MLIYNYHMVTTHSPNMSHYLRFLFQFSKKQTLWHISQSPPTTSKMHNHNHEVGPDNDKLLNTDKSMLVGNYIVKIPFIEGFS